MEIVAQLGLLKIYQNGFSFPKQKILTDLYQLGFLFKSTQSRDRTGMEVNPLVFETSASTNSAIWAFDLFSNAWQRYGFFLNAQTFDYFFLNIIQRQIKSQIIYLALYLFEYIKST